MHKIYISIFVFIIIPCFSNAQSIPNAATNPEFYSRIKFIADAPLMLSILYKERKFDEIQNYSNNWSLSTAPSFEIIFALNILTGIQNKQLDIQHQPANFFRLLDEYSKECREIKESNDLFRYYIYLNTGQKYDATESAIKIFAFLQSWSADLLATHKLSNSESYFCNVFAGKIEYPKKYFIENSNSLPEINEFDNSMDSILNKCFIERRNKSRFVANIFAGIWIPKNNVNVIVGPDFCLGFQFGWRNKKNEYDLSIGFRTPKRTNKSYTFLKNDTVYTSNYYDGANYSFDYTHYFIHHPKLDIGYMGGIGYDGIDAVDGNGTPSSEVIGSLNMEAGLHAKYYFGRGPCLGIQTLYHFLNYSNKGGSDFNGNAFSIIFYLGTK